MNLVNARTLLQNFDFTRLFVEELGWSNPSSGKSVPMAVKGIAFNRREVAQLSGVVVIEVVTDDGVIPDAAARSAIHKEIAKLHHENVLIFVDAKRSQSLWYWAKRQDRRLIPRTHIYVHGQSGDLLLSKLGAMAVDFADFDDSGHVPLLEVTARLKQALDIERVTKKFYGEFQEQHVAFIELIEGIGDERDRRWYASVLLNRLMFIYFLQKKFFLDGGDEFYLQNKLAQSRKGGADRYYAHFLKPLFFEGFAKPEDKRTAEVNALLGKIKYLNGGLFLPHPVELRWPKIAVPDKAFENLLGLFGNYSWNLNDTPGGQDNEINPDVLGYIFEKYINQKAFGAYYTRPEITEYLCERTIHRLILDGVNGGAESGAGVPPANSRRAAGTAAPHFDSVGDLLLALDAPLCKKLLHEVLPNMRLLDPACGSAAFLVSAMKTLINVYAAVIGKIDFLSDRSLQEWLKKTQKDYKSVSYFIKRSIITNNLFGVDIMEEATEIAKLRLFLALVASAQNADDLEPLPNIEFNIMAGNSLIGLLHIDPAKFNALTAGACEQKRMTLVHEPGPGDLGFAVESTVAKTRKEMEREYLAQVQGRKLSDLLAEKNELIDVYRRAFGRQAEDLQGLRDGIAAKKSAANTTINRLLLDQFQQLGIKYEEATWDDKKNAEGKSKKRALKDADIAALKPFHWGYEFDCILAAGGFDAIITNPPWEIFKPNAKEFFEEYSDLVSKKKMTIKEFEKAQARLLKDPDIRTAWLKYLSEYPYVSTFYRSAPQYKNQSSIVDGKKAGSDTNLYKLFLEQCHNLLRPGGRCGIIIPSGVYTDLGTKQLREMLFSASELDTLFGLSNEKFIFEAVHHAFKFCILSFTKGGESREFRAAFRINPREAVAANRLEDFLHTQTDHLQVSVDLVRRLAPDSLSVMEFRCPVDVKIAEKMACFQPIKSAPCAIRLKNEFHMTNDSRLYHLQRRQAMLPLIEGKLFHQFTGVTGEPKYWLNEVDARRALLGKEEDQGQMLDYQKPRLAFRDVSAATNERCVIATVLPPRVFCPHTVSLEDVANSGLSDSHRLLLLATFNSFVFDYAIRQKVTSHVSFFFVYAMPVPRLTIKDAAFRPVVERAARLICTTPEFDDLAKKIFGGQATAKTVGATDAAERAKLRAELDALVAQLYGLADEEFAYILTTFPLVPDAVKIAAHNAFRNVEKGFVK